MRASLELVFLGQLFDQIVTEISRSSFQFLDHCFIIYLLFLGPYADRRGCLIMGVLTSALQPLSGLIIQRFHHRRFSASYDNYIRFYAEILLGLMALYLPSIF